MGIWDDAIGVVAGAAAPETGGASLLLPMLGQLGGSAISGGLDFLGTSSANAANTANAQAQRDWQTMMDNTKYQRAVKDLQAAGLNPMMAYGNMSASTPSGAMPAPMQSTLAGSAGAIRESASKISEMGQRQAQSELLRQQVEQSKMTNAQMAAQIKEIDSKIGLNNAEVLRVLATIPQIKASARASNASAANAEAENANKGMWSNIYDVGGKVTGAIKGIAGDVHSAVSGSDVGKSVSAVYDYMMGKTPSISKKGWFK